MRAVSALLLLFTTAGAADPPVARLAEVADQLGPWARAYRRGVITPVS
jgi:hypothetical protein